MSGAFSAKSGFRFKDRVISAIKKKNVAVELIYIFAHSLSGHNEMLSAKKPKE
jgi:hypothetical protein